MTRKICAAFLLATPFLLFFACDNFSFNFNFGSGSGKENGYYLVELTKDIKDKVVDYAYEYANSDTFYEYGGQDPLRAIGIDCSGLVVMCYTYALEGTGFSLLEPDMTAAYMHDYASDHTLNPEPGDLVFMGESNSSKITHIGIFIEKIGSEIYFIDSTSSDSVNGVSKRNYADSNPKIKGFGVMRIKCSY